jgi:hypothetical protein
VVSTKGPQFCHAYTHQYRNLGVHATTRRVEANHHLLHKVSDATFRICSRLESLIEDYEQQLSRSRISEPRLIDTTFFRHTLGRVAHYCLTLCSFELLKASSYGLMRSGLWGILSKTVLLISLALIVEFQGVLP